MKISFAFILCSALFLAIGCKTNEPKPVGCTDDNAVNYDMQAEEDDGSCEYVADLYEGVYNVVETRTWEDVDSGDEVSDEDQFTMIIEKVTNTTVLVHNVDFCDPLEANVTESFLTFTDIPFDCAVYNSAFVRIGSDIEYEYETFVGYPVDVSGIATKQ